MLFRSITENQKMSSSFLEVLEFVIVHQRLDLVPALEKVLPTADRRSQALIIKVFHFFTYEISIQTSEFLIGKFSNFDHGCHKIILRLIAYANYARSLSWMCSLFESRSRSLRSAALSTVVYFLEKFNGETELLEIYRQRQWSPEAGDCWYRIFNSQSVQFQNILGTMRANESEALISHCIKLKVLENQQWQNSMLYVAVAEDLNARIRFFLNFFSTEYEAETLTILERALAQPNSTRKFEALELLQSSKNKNLANLLTPFLEFDNYSEILDNLPDATQDLPTLHSVLKNCLEGENAWIRACALHDIGNNHITDFRHLVERLSLERMDLTSQEMAMVCLEKWECR